MVFVTEALDKIGYVDFGFSRKKEKDTRCGTLLNVSPEFLFSDTYDTVKNETWSFGMFLLSLFFGKQNILSSEFCNTLQIFKSLKGTKNAKIQLIITRIREFFNLSFDKKKEKWRESCGKESVRILSTSILRIFVKEEQRIELPELLSSLKKSAEACKIFTKEETDLLTTSDLAEKKTQGIFLQDEVEKDEEIGSIEPDLENSKISCVWRILEEYCCFIKFLI
jgi:hypothetical protein